MTTTDLPIEFSTQRDASNMLDFLNNHDSEQFKPLDMEELVDTASEEWYYVGPNQVRVPTDALSEYGKSEYKKVLERVNTEAPKQVLTQCWPELVSSGMWFPSKKSPHYEEGQFIRLCNMSDIILKGKIGENQYLTTSLVKWMGTRTDGVCWAITKSGSLYHYVRD